MVKKGSNSQTGTVMEWMDLRALQGYAAVSERTLRDWVNRAVNPLPAVRVASKILIRRSAFDRWLESHPYQPAENIDVRAIVDDVLSGLREAR